MESFRAKRLLRLLTEVPQFLEYRVIDLGGSLEFWNSLDRKPRDLTLINLEAEEQLEAPGIEIVTMDVQDLSTTYLTEFDFIFSNSLIEHLGGYLPRRILAERIIQSEKPYWIQTPYRYFPIEPHWQFLGAQFLPLRLQAGLSRHIPWGHMRIRDGELALEESLMLDSISRTEMRHLFPGALVLAERFFGMTKSIVALKRGIVA